MRAIAVCLVLAARTYAQEGTVSFDVRTDTGLDFVFDLVEAIAGFFVCLPVLIFFWRRAMTNAPVSLKLGDMAPSAFDAAQAAGIIGIAHDLPSDLSTNPKHFERFGES